MLCILNREDSQSDTSFLERALAKTDLQAEIYRVKSADDYRAALANVQLHAELEDHVAQRTPGLEESNEELEAFSCSFSHELAAPLMQLDAYLGFLKRNYGAQLDDTANGYLANARKSADRITRLTQDLLRLSKGSRSQLRCERVDLSRMAREIASKLAASAPQRQIDWFITEGLVADVDPGLIQVALDNLLSNAWKYTTHCTRARIEFGAVTRPQGPVEYYIRDNGAGFDMESAGQLFQPFNRLHSKDEFPGSGIGLATVRRIIERHGGRIWATGEVGRGAIVRFTLGVLERSSDENTCRRAGRG
jgi:light-regulated signal transduction histidine kinase (bacteriophytochrome)